MAVGPLTSGIRQIPLSADGRIDTNKLDVPKERQDQFERIAGLKQHRPGWDQVAPIFSPTEDLVATFRTEPDSFKTFIASAVEQNRDYFFPKELPTKGSEQDVMFRARANAFVQESVSLAADTFKTDLNGFNQGLSAIDHHASSMFSDLLQGRLTDQTLFPVGPGGDPTLGTAYSTNYERALTLDELGWRPQPRTAFPFLDIDNDGVPNLPLSGMKRDEGVLLMDLCTGLDAINGAPKPELPVTLTSSYFDTRGKGGES